MPPSDDHTTLELLLTEPEREAQATVVLLPRAPGSGIDAIAGPLAKSLDHLRWRLLPAPLSDEVVAQRAWHRDLWVAMPAAIRSSVALATGATAAYLAPVLGDLARTVALVSDPLAALGIMGASLPKRRALEGLAETPVAEAPRLRRFANPQSRALLAPWHDPRDLPVSLGPPHDCDRWREALFDDVLPRLDAAPTARTAEVVRPLVRSLGGRPSSVVQAARTAVEAAVEASAHPQLADLLLELNWLDAELYARCVAAGQD